MLLPAASARDIDYLLEHVNEILAEPLSRDDVVAVYAGLRPLLAGGAGTTAKLSREHTVSRIAPGLVVVADGKFTTYRVIAAQALDEAATQLGRPVPRSCTDRVPLVGAAGFLALWNGTNWPQSTAWTSSSLSISCTGTATLSIRCWSLGWPQTDVDRELRQYRAAVSAALDAEGEPDSQSAEAALRRALEVPLSA